MSAQIYRKPRFPQPQMELAAMDKRAAKAAFGRRIRDDLEEDLRPVAYRVEHNEVLAKQVWEFIKVKKSRIGVVSAIMLTSGMAVGSYCDFLGGGHGLYSRIFGNLDSPTIPYIFGAAAAAIVIISYVLESRNFRMEIQAANGQAK